MEMRRESRRWLFSAGLFCFVATAALVFDITADKGDVIRRVPTTHKVVALTFDDGPDRRTTPEVLNVLAQKKVRATLFVLGEYAAKYPEIVARAVAEGHEIGSHSYSHRLFSRISPAEMRRELAKAEAAIAAVAPKPLLFRPPGGALNNEVKRVVHEAGYTIILWNVDTRDWQRPKAADVVAQVLRDIKPGSIVLFHDGLYPLPTAEAVGIIIDRLREQGYEILPVGELLQYYEVRN